MRMARCRNRELTGGPDAAGSGRAREPGTGGHVGPSRPARAQPPAQMEGSWVEGGRCHSTTRDDRRCAAKALPGDRYCPWQSPEWIGRRQECRAPTW